MLDINRIRLEPDKIAELLSRKLCQVDFTELLDADKRKRELLREVEGMKAEKNKVSAMIPQLKKKGEPTDEVFREMKELCVKIAEAE